MVKDIRDGRYGVDILAVIAILSTVAIGEFWAAIVIALMLTSGEALEDYAAGRATRELSALLERAPQFAHRLGKGSELQDVPIGDVRVGDKLMVKPGEVVPVDSTLNDEAAAFDESSLTGESMPVERTVGQALLSGAVNTDRAITITTTRIARDSQYQQIIELVKNASSTQAPFVRMADRYAVPFTLVSLLIAGIAWALTGEALRFAEVLVVATPCPLLLGAPIALISGMSRAAKHGIIVKNGATLEKLARISTVAFDKTGTLTMGQPAVDVIQAQPGATEEELLALAASVEQHSVHTLAQALVEASEQRQLKLEAATNVREEVAQGASAEIAGERVLIGKKGYLVNAHIPVDETASVVGQTAVYVARGGKFIGRITFTDKVRENSLQTLDRLRGLGIGHTLMLTGDALPTAERIAASLGITDLKAECLPKDKVDAVAAVTDRPVMMVGDGVNDAPVLAAADVGLALSARGSTVASQTADVVVLVDDISRAAVAIDIAQSTIRIALQSIWTGIGMSVGLMLVAATGVIPAVVGAALQEVVDVVVIINALRAHGSWSK